MTLRHSCQTIVALLALLCLGSGLIGCPGDSGPDFEGLIGSHKESGEAKLKALETLGGKLSELPEAAENRVTAPEPELMLKTNATVMTVEDFEDLNKYTGPKVAPTEDDFIRVAAAAIRQDITPGLATEDSYKQLQGYLERLEKLRYVMVVRTVEAEAPSAGATLIPGVFIGEVFIFDLGEENKLLGSYRFEVDRQSHQIEVGSDENADAEALEDFRNYIDQALWEGYQKHLPDAG